MTDEITFNNLNFYIDEIVDIINNSNMKQKDKDMLLATTLSEISSVYGYNNSMTKTRQKKIFKILLDKFGVK